ncbi:retrovirus-related Pol polyprotein from transposon TNT 1-94 [Trifolium medium]|uniref:Retrovirus-related Pol polyprotein from transposon TNT 1-94 n=1 Tax=Trifolium medium TaxID=97028 RepID=A0A392LWM2_9FABA|nr:retrovirus-related Pol polyprotein from transposon TNT 1-94 [Trifolium medium]
MNSSDSTCLDTSFPSVNVAQLEINANSSVFSPMSHANYNLWHARLGHPHHDSLRIALQLCNINVPSKPQTELCSACCLGKSRRIHAPLSKTIYKSPFELVVCDLWGPAPMKSSTGFTYFLTCIDAYSRFTWVYPLKLKSETLTKFVEFKKMVELQFNCKIRTVQTDGGGEFRPFTKFLTNLGVVHRLTCPHTHHQNGLVERKHRHLVETGLTLLSQANIPLKNWDHAFITAAFLINKMPTPILQNNSPYFTLLNKQPDYKALKIFGCACFPFLRPYHTTKLAYRSQECVFLGYSSTYKGYKCLSPDGHIYVSKDVLFNEQKFPYHQLFPSSHTTTPPPISSTSLSQVPLHLPTQVLDPVPITIVPNTTISEPSSSASSTPSSPHNHDPTTPQPSSPPNSENSYSNSSNIQMSNASQHIFSPLSSGSTPESSHEQITTPQPSQNHTMITRSKARANPTLLLTHFEPTTAKQALQSSEWVKAMQEEYNALMKNNTWTLVDPPNHKRPIGCKWVFRIKENPDGTINKYKARLVAKGFHQKAGSDFTETFSPVVKPVTVRTVLTIVVTNKWPIQQIDVNNAFLNGLLEEEVYMQQPPGFETSDKTLVCKLNKAL